MKILAFSDVHENTKLLDSIAKTAKKEKPDLLVCTGDLSVFENNLQSVVKKLDSIGIETFVIHGNHEEGSLLQMLCKRSKHVRFVHGKVFRKGNIVFFSFGGGGFSKKEPALEHYVNHYKKLKKKGDKAVFLTHAPPYGTKLDIVPGFGHVGCKSTTDFAKKGLFDLLICGHIHECAGKRDRIRKCDAYNLSLTYKMLKI